MSVENRPCEFCVPLFAREETHIFRNVEKGEDSPEVKKVMGEDLVIFSLRRGAVNLSSFVYLIINLCVKWSWVPGASVAGTFPDKKFFVLCWLN